MGHLYHSKPQGVCLAVTFAATNLSKVAAKQEPAHPEFFRPDESDRITRKWLEPSRGGAPERKE